MNIDLSPELPHGFSGTWTPNKTYSFNSALQVAYAAYIRSASLEMSDNKAEQVPMLISAYCSGECKTTVRAPGVARTGCVEKRWPVTKSMLRDPSSVWGSGDGMPSKPLFFSNMALFGEFRDSGPMWTPGREAALVTTGTLDLEDCSGVYVETHCTISSAVLEYDVVVRGHEISFATTAASGRVLAEANNTFFDIYANAKQDVTLMLLILLFEPSTSANATLSYLASKGEVDGISFDTFNFFAMKHFKTSLVRSPCEVHFSDPTNDIVAMLNSIMFRAGVMTASWQNMTGLLDEGLSVHQTVPAQQTESQNVFHTDLRWFAGAATIQSITIIIVLPVFWGWWNVGVELTLSPFHTAKLLDAPVLECVNSAAGATGISNDLGDRKVQLGLVESLEPSGPTRTDGKLPGGVDFLYRSRIGITNPHGVARPRKGMRFTH